ncbi:MAG: GNAT family N-acetyltransferase [Actinomycetota bacterium]
MDVEVKALASEELDSFIRTISRVFAHEISDADLQAERWILELGEVLGAVEAGSLVGGLGACPLDLTVPGGVVETTGIVTTGVLPNRRRRGILTSLMRQHLEDAHERGAVLSILWASEGAIYGRFGYGAGTLSCRFDIAREHTAYAARHMPAGEVTLLSREEAEEAFPVVYEQLRAGQPGVVSRSDVWWRYWLYEPERKEHPGQPFYAVHESAGGLDGYVIYRQRRDWTDASPNGSIEVEELVANTPGAVADLWRFVFDVDLVARFSGGQRPVDEPLLHLLREPRRLRLAIGDGLWVRPIDIQKALASRRYATEGRIVLQALDPFCPWNDRHLALDGGPDGAECGPTDAQPEIFLDASALGSVLLGGTRFRSLARGGRIVGTDEALDRADAMFGWDPVPWCPGIF